VQETLQAGHQAWASLWRMLNDYFCAAPLELAFAHEQASAARAAHLLLLLLLLQAPLRVAPCLGASGKP